MWMTLLKAFVTGGVICGIGQLLMDLTSYKITPAHILVGYVCGGAIISAFGLYQPLVDWGGSGATVPLSGFGHMMTQGAIEGAKEGFLGAIGGGLKAGAVGISVAVIMGVLIAALFKPKG
ncbi:MAG: SpoVA/SpoVAEb family sporulation membrane protein [Peptococcaceae bacterium]|nr:SpoVA/SpoVAEb family sporulation membrane protein [Peptococcaceae bacterium]